MDMHDMKRVELIIERMAMKRACRVLEAVGMTGYTVLPALAGYGNNRRWERDTDISMSQDMVVFITIGDAERVDILLQQVSELLGSHVGVVSVSDVQVLRPDRF